MAENERQCVELYMGPVDGNRTHVREWVTKIETIVNGRKEVYIRTGRITGDGYIVFEWGPGKVGSRA